MDIEIREEFRALRDDNRRLREEMRGDIRALHAKLDENLAAINSRCASRGEEIAVLTNRDAERDKRIDRRIALGLFIIAAITLLLKLV